MNTLMKLFRPFMRGPSCEEVNRFLADYLEGELNAAPRFPPSGFVGLVNPGFLGWVLGWGGVFWGVGFFKEGMGMPVALIADQETRLRLWSREKLQPILIDNGQFTWDLTQLMAERMMQASRILEELAFQPVAGRLAHLLLAQFKDQSGDTMARDLTLDDMAARIGSTREMVCRHLYQFSDKGAIQINRTEFKITDLNYLETIADKGK